MKIKTDIPAHWDRKHPAIEIGISHYLTALDQSHEYESVGQAIESYAQNAVDTAREQGLPKELWLEAGESVLILFRLNTAR